MCCGRRDSTPAEAPRPASTVRPAADPAPSGWAVRMPDGQVQVKRTKTAAKMLVATTPGAAPDGWEW